jgi:hypothetical protein
MGQSSITDTFKSGESVPAAAKLFTRPFLGASQVFQVGALGLRIKAAPDVIALLAPHLTAQLVVAGNTVAEFPTIEAQAIAPPPPPPSPDPSPDDADADADADAAAPAPEPPAPASGSNYVPDVEDPFDGQGQAKFIPTSAYMRGTQTYCVVLTFDRAALAGLSQPFELVAYLVGERKMQS